MGHPVFLKKNGHITQELIYVRALHGMQNATLKLIYRSKKLYHRLDIECKQLIKEKLIIHTIIFF